MVTSCRKGVTVGKLQQCVLCVRERETERETEYLQREIMRQTEADVDYNRFEYVTHVEGGGVPWM